MLDSHSEEFERFVCNISITNIVDRAGTLGDVYLIYWFPDYSLTNFTGSGGR